MTSPDIRRGPAPDNHPIRSREHARRTALRRAGRSRAMAALRAPGLAFGDGLLPAWGIGLLTLAMLAALVIPH